MTARDQELPATPGGEVIVYESPEGVGSVDVRFEHESVWLTQLQMAEVFQSTRENILMHLRNIFSDKELDAEATTKDFLVVRSGGKRTVRRIALQEPRRKGGKPALFRDQGSPLH